MAHFVTVMKRQGSGGLVPIETKQGTEIATIVSKATDLRPAFRRIVAMGRHMVLEEFDRGAHRQPRGGFRAWPATKTFGNRPAPTKTLVRSGRLREAWAGGAGSVEDITRGYATFGVLSPRYGDVHRTGARIPVSRRMRMFLGLQFQVWLAKDKTVITIPPRPYADLETSIEFADRAAAILAEHVQVVEERLAS